MSQVKKPELTYADLIALVEACAEQGMELAPTLRELRTEHFCSLRAGMDLLKYALKESTNPACDALRERMALVGNY